MFVIIAVIAVIAIIAIIVAVALRDNKAHNATINAIQANGMNQLTYNPNRVATLGTGRIAPNAGHGGKLRYFENYAI